MTKRMLLLCSALSVGLGVAVVSGDEAAAPAAPADETPMGCVSCHVEKDGKDMRLPQMLGRIKGHPNVAGMVKEAPTGCTMCHKKGPKPPALSEAVHKAHFGADKPFVKTYGFACTACHKMDGATGKVSMKNGPKNW